MDVGSTNSIVNAAVAMMAQKNSDALNVAVMKKAMDMQASAAATLLQALDQPLATSGSLGTQVNTYA